jgi:adenylosuccinate synthase
MKIYRLRLGYVMLRFRIDSYLGETMAGNTDASKIKSEVEGIKKELAGLQKWSRETAQWIKSKHSEFDSLDTWSQNIEKKIDTNTKGHDKTFDRINKDLDVQNENTKSFEKDIGDLKRNWEVNNKFWAANNKNWTDAWKLMEKNREALVRAKKYVDDSDSSADKKVENLKKVMDEMEKRHAKLIQTQINNYDKAIRKFVTQEVAKISKGRR